MYGYVHVILKDFVVSVAGPAAWNKILRMVGRSGPGAEVEVLELKAHDDELTLELVSATCKFLGVSLDDALRAFGRHFIVFAIRSGSATFLKSHGATFRLFLQSVNSIYNYLERDLPTARFPSVEAEYNPAEDCVNVLYVSVREGVSSMLVGMVEEIGKRLYGVDVSFEKAEVQKEFREAVDAGRAKAWKITWCTRPEGPVSTEVTEGALPTHKVSFPALHAGMMGFAQVMRSACRCARPVKAGVDGGSDSGDDLPMTESGIMKKRGEVRRGERPLDDILLRSTKAAKVAATWWDTALPHCRAFWKTSAGRAQDYNLSEDASHIDVFVSHAWSPPDAWEAVMGREVEYADVKSAMLAVMAKDIALSRNEFSKWGDVSMWVDKACIPQQEEDLKRACIGSIDKFIKHCDYVCVLFTWSYLKRLWCVFEWACLLLDKEPRQVWLQDELFVNEQSFPLYVEAIRSFSLARAECFSELDRTILLNMINDNYTSEAAFENLVKATATGLMARSMAFRAGRSTRLHNRFFTPLVQLAAEIGFGELSAALGSCKVLEWRGTASHRSLRRQGALTDVSVCTYRESINAWFDSTVSPVLLKVREKSVILK